MKTLLRAAFFLGLWMVPWLTRGEVAITEVMTNPAAIDGHADFWELTNFGSETVVLDDYWFADNKPFSQAQRIGELSPGLQLAPGESMIFAETDRDDVQPDDFRAWWGNLSPTLKVIPYVGFGLSSRADALHLWRQTELGVELIDRIELSEWEDNVSITVNPQTGALTEPSLVGVAGGRASAFGPEIGSPGTAPAAIPLQIAEPPQSVVVDGGNPAQLSVRAVGLPRPRFQWYFNGHPLAGANQSSYAIPNSSPSEAGEYRVEVFNGLFSTNPPAVTLVVNTTPSAPSIVRGPEDVECYVGLSPTFSVTVRGYPLPAFQWQRAGEDLSGETNATLRFQVTDEAQAGLYSVRVGNAHSEVSAQARLTIIPKPDLRVTEYMAAPAPSTETHRGNDWWELTNAGPFPVNLKGYRFNDGPDLSHAITVTTNDAILPPGCSAVLVSTLTPEEFRRWWGAENLPPDLIILSYPGNGFRAEGDQIFLWHPSAIDDSQFLVSESFINLEVAVSLWIDEEHWQGSPSVLGERGAFGAALASDVGSPGWLTNQQAARPRLGRIDFESDRCRTSWRVQPGWEYEAEYQDHRINGELWISIGRQRAEATTLTLTNSVAEGAARYYRLRLIEGTP